MAGRGNPSFAAGYHARRRQEGPRLQAAYRQGQRDTWLQMIGAVASIGATAILATQRDKWMAKLRPSQPEAASTSD